MSDCKRARSEPAAPASLTARCRVLALSADLIVAASQFLDLRDLAQLARCHSVLQALCTLGDEGDGNPAASPAVVRRQSLRMVSDSPDLAHVQSLWRLAHRMPLLEHVVLRSGWVGQLMAQTGERGCYELFTRARADPERPLRTVDVDHLPQPPSDTDDQSARVLLRLLRANRRLEVLRIAECVQFCADWMLSLTLQQLPLMKRLRVFDCQGFELGGRDLRAVFEACPALQQLSVRLPLRAIAQTPGQALSAEVFAAAPRTLTDLNLCLVVSDLSAQFAWACLAPLAKQLVHLELSVSPSDLLAAAPLAPSPDAMDFESLQTLTLGGDSSTFGPESCGPLRFPALTRLTAGEVDLATREPPSAQSGPVVVVMNMAPALQELIQTGPAWIGEDLVRLFERQPTVCWPHLRLLHLLSASRVFSVAIRERLRAARPSLVLRIGSDD